MTGGLFDPLGKGPAPARRRLPALSAPTVALALAGALLLALSAIAALRDDGLRGRPVAVAPIAHVAAPPKPEPPPPPPAPPTPPAPPAAAPALPPADGALPLAQADQEVEIQNGVRIIRPRRPPPAPGASPAAGNHIVVPPAAGR